MHMNVAGRFNFTRIQICIDIEVHLARSISIGRFFFLYVTVFVKPKANEASNRDCHVQFFFAHTVIDNASIYAGIDVKNQSSIVPTNTLLSARHFCFILFPDFDTISRKISVVTLICTIF